MPDDFGDLAVNTRVHFYYPLRTRGCGCAMHPAFPTPSGYRAENFWYGSGVWRRENAKVCAAVKAPKDRAQAGPDRLAISVEAPIQARCCELGAATNHGSVSQNS
jgi:hypothetical protein